MQDRNFLRKIAMLIKIFGMLRTKIERKSAPMSMIARHKKPRHDLIVLLHLKSCGVAEKSLRGCLRRAIIEVATPPVTEI